MPFWSASSSEPKPAPPWQQYLLALGLAVGALLAREMLVRVLGDPLSFLPVFGVLLILVLLLRPRPFLAAALVCGLGLTWRLGDSELALGLPLFVAAVALAAVAAWLAARAQERVHAAWRAAEERREALRVTLASIGDAIITTDAAGRITFLNPVACEVTGWNLADATRRPLSEVFRVVDESGGEPIGNPVERVLQQAQPMTLAQHAQLLRRDGSAREIDDRAAPICGADGRIIGVVLIFRDISQRRAAERALREREQELSEFFETASVALQWLAPEGRIERVNRAQLELLGLPQDQVLGRDFADFLEDGDAKTAFLTPLVEGESMVERPARLRCGDGSRRDVLIRASARRVDGRFVQARLFTLDFTERKRAEAERNLLVARLRHADRRKDEFLATLAHELRNPLAPVTHGLQVLTSSEADPAAKAQARVTIERQLRLMVRLVEDLLDVSRITRDRLELRLEPTALAGVLEQALDANRPALAAAGQTVRMDLLPPPLWLRADAVRLVQVFSNLLVNASKFSPPGSPITVEVQVLGDAVEVAVADRGIGIDAELMPHIFEMFTQGDRDAGRARSGLGIGLALARRLVQLHGGDIVAHSAGPGQGSRFVVRLPLACAPQATPDAAALRPAAPLAPASARRILVVDDNRDAAQTLAMLLNLSGHTVRTAHDGLAALAAAADFRPDAVLLDIGMPLLDGHEVARRLRAEPWGGEMVLVAISGWGQPPDRAASSQAGFDTHLVKPVEHDVLLNLLGELLARRDARRSSG